MEKVVIKVDGISKVYRLYNNPVDRLKEALNPFKKLYHKNFYALKNINFEIRKGETIGIIGANGSGKSTLLKILTGVLTPSAGKTHVIGKISSLLELGAGFNLELSGLENIYFNGSILGYTKIEIDQKLSDILEFADIGEFISQPVKMYSSGMQMRLAFAIAINVDPDILIVDEALAVGDMRFQQKCFRKLKEFKDGGKTIIFVSHDMGVVNNYCDRAIWLKDGVVCEQGNAEIVTRKYISYMTYGMESKVNKLENNSESNGKGFDDSELESLETISSFGEGGALIKKVGLYSLDGGQIKLFKGGERVSLYVQFEVLQDINNPIVGFIIKDKYENQILGFNSYVSEGKLKTFQKGDLVNCVFEFDFPLLKNGNYVFAVAVAEGTQDSHIQHHWVHDAYFVQIMNNEQNAKLSHFFIVQNQVFRIIN